MKTSGISQLWRLLVPFRCRPNRRRKSGPSSAECLEPRELLAVRIWDGGAAFNDRWTDRENWVSNIAPVAGDDLVFPAGIGLLDRGTRNDFNADVSFRNITVESDGYTLNGNRFKLTGDLAFTASGKLEVKADIRFASGVRSIIAEGPDGSTAKIILDNVLSGDGTAGSLTFRSGNDTGIIFTKGNQPNTYANSFVIDGAQMILNKADNVVSISGPLTANGPETRVDVFDDPTSDRHALGQFKPGVDVRIINSDSSGSLNISKETIGKLTLNNGKLNIFPVKSSADPADDGLLILQQAVEANGIQNIIDGENLQISGFAGSREFIVNGQKLLLATSIKGGHLVKKGSGELILVPNDQPNTFSSLSLLTGTAVVPTVASGKSTLPRTVSIGTGPGAGNAALRVDSVSDVIPNDGSITVGSSSRLELLNTKDSFSRITLNSQAQILLDTAVVTLAQDLDAGANAQVSLVDRSTLNVSDDTFLDPGAAIFVDGTSGLLFGDTLTMRDGQLNVAPGGNAVLGGRLSVQAGTGTSSITGNLFLKKGAHDFQIADGPQAIDLTVVGSLRNEPDKQPNAASVKKLGPGTMQILGSSNYTGTTTVSQGALIVDGTQPNSPIVAVQGTRVGGRGTAKSVSMNSGSLLRPGANSPATFHTTTTGFLAGSKFAPVLASATSFDQLQTTTLILDRFLVDDTTFQFATLDVSRTFAVPLGTQFRIIDVTGTAPANLETIFQDPAGVPLPDGSQFLVNSQAFTIDYNGGDGNDIVITRNNAPAFANRTLTPVVTEGGIATLSGTITEPNPGDTFFLDVDWGDGTQMTYRFGPGSSRQVQVQHTYLDDEIAGQDDLVDVKLVWRDQFGGANQTTLQTRLVNAPPELLSPQAVIVNPGTRTVELKGLIRDSGRDSVTVLVQWSEGLPVQQFRLAAGTSSFKFRHNYNRSGNHHIKIIVVDDDFGLVQHDMEINVPSLAASLNSQL